VKERSMVPAPEFESYYGKQIIKTPTWKTPDVPLYLFLGGMAGASAVLAEGAAVTGNEPLERVARIAAASGAGLGTVFLVHDLGRPERVQGQLRVVGLDRREDRLVPLDAEVGRMTALQHDLGRAEVERLATAAQDLLIRVRPAFFVLGGPVEGAELAGGQADVRVVDVAIDDVGRDVVREPAATHRVGRLAEGVQGGAGVERERLVRRDPATVGSAVKNVLQP